MVTTLKYNLLYLCYLRRQIVKKNFIRPTINEAVFFFYTYTSDEKENKMVKGRGHKKIRF